MSSNLTEYTKNLLNSIIFTFNGMIKASNRFMENMNHLHNSFHYESATSSEDQARLLGQYKNYLQLFLNDFHGFTKSEIVLDKFRSRNIFDGTTEYKNRNIALAYQTPLGKVFNKTICIIDNLIYTETDDYIEFTFGPATITLTKNPDIVDFDTFQDILVDYLTAVTNLRNNFEKNINLAQEAIRMIDILIIK